MKKLVYMAMVAFAASMVACGGSDKNAAADAVDSAAVVVEEVAAEVAAPACACDSCTNDSTCACGCQADTVTVAEAAAVVE